MRPPENRKWSKYDEPSPREKREMRDCGEWQEENDRPRGKAPWPLRLLAWLSLIAIFFAVGYGATSLLFRWMDRGGISRHPDNVVASEQGVQEIVRAVASQDVGSSGASTVSCVISIPVGTEFETRQIQCRGGIREDTIQETLTAYLDAVKEGKLLDPAAQSLNIFQSGDWLYLNMNQSFLESLRILGGEKTRFLLTGLVKTMTDNFSPINKIKFYIGGREVKDKNPVDLSMPWGLESGSS